MSATRIKTDKGEGDINGMKTAEKRLEPNLQQGSANELTVAQRKLDMNGDGTLTGIDFQMLGNKSKKRTA